MAGCEVSVSIISSKVNVISTVTLSSYEDYCQKKVKLEWENKLNKNLQPIYSCNIKYTNYCHVQPTIKKII